MRDDIEQAMEDEAVRKWLRERPAELRGDPDDHYRNPPTEDEQAMHDHAVRHWYNNRPPIDDPWDNWANR